MKARRQQHDLKAWPESFRAVISGRKRFEIRKDDRHPPFQSGDQVTLHEFEPRTAETEAMGYTGPGGFTGRRATFLIGYVARSAALPPGWCGFELVSLEEANRVGLAVLGPEGRAEREG
jgi:hypothetical protein